MLDIRQNYVFSDKVAEIIDIAINGNKNVLLWGPAGHGKSEMSVACVKAAGQYQNCFIQSFGEGMDESRIYGGVNYEKLDKEFVIEYNVDRSFIVHEVAIFEEIFDAPAIVLQSLKDTLTARCLRNGAQRVPMKTKSIIAITNINPAEISDIGPSAHALVERFPLQLEVKWEEYNQESYLAMFERVYPKFNKSVKKFLARLVERANEQGSFISPRTAIHALELLMTMCGEDGSDLDYKSYKCLEYIPGFEVLIKDVSDEIEEMKQREDAERSIRSISRKISAIRKQIDNLNDDEDKNDSGYLRIAKQISPQVEKLNLLALPDHLIEERDKLIRTCHELKQYLVDAALNSVD